MHSPRLHLREALQLKSAFGLAGDRGELNCWWIGLRWQGRHCAGTDFRLGARLNADRVPITFSEALGGNR